MRKTHIIEKHLFSYNDYLSSLSSYIYISNYSLQLLDVGFTKIKRVQYMIFIF